MSTTEVATFAGGCFWGMEKWFRKMFPNGIQNIVVGYTGGKTLNPKYEDVHTGETMHAESIKIEFDPKIIKYSQLLDLFWRIHDPTTLNRQGNDIGTQYRSSIFYHSDSQKIEAEKSKEEAKKHWGDKIATLIVPATTFYLAEDYHQEYLIKNPTGYCIHRLYY